MNELKHYGVLGMKWGRRKGSTSSGSSTKQIRRAEKKATKHLNAASKALFRAKDYKKSTDPAAKKLIDPAEKYANKQINKAKNIVDKYKITKTKGLYNLLDTKNGKAWWESNGYYT